MTLIQEHTIPLEVDTLITYNLTHRAQILGFRQDPDIPANILLAEAHEQKNEGTDVQRKFRFVPLGGTFPEGLFSTDYHCSAQWTDPATSTTQEYYLFEVLI